MHCHSACHLARVHPAHAVSQTEDAPVADPVLVRRMTEQISICVLIRDPLRVQTDSRCARHLVRPPGTTPPKQFPKLTMQLAQATEALFARPQAAVQNLRDAGRQSGRKPRGELDACLWNRRSHRHVIENCAKTVDVGLRVERVTGGHFRRRVPGVGSRCRSPLVDPHRLIQTDQLHRAIVNKYPTRTHGGMYEPVLVQVYQSGCDASQNADGSREFQFTADHVLQGVFGTRLRYHVPAPVVLKAGTVRQEDRIGGKPRSLQ